jgi:hypothetical protein
MAVGGRSGAHDLLGPDFRCNLVKMMSKYELQVLDGGERIVENCRTSKFLRS